MAPKSKVKTKRKHVDSGSSSPSSFHTNTIVESKGEEKQEKKKTQRKRNSATTLDQKQETKIKTKVLETKTETLKSGDKPRPPAEKKVKTGTEFASLDDALESIERFADSSGDKPFLDTFREFELSKQEKKKPFQIKRLACTNRPLSPDEYERYLDLRVEYVQLKERRLLLGEGGDANDSEMKNKINHEITHIENEIEALTGIHPGRKEQSETKKREPPIVFKIKTTPPLAVVSLIP